jgi:tetratricopeptide (TPR) repeat protein
MQSQRYFHLYLRAARVESKSEDAVARGWVMLATVLQQRKCYRRSEWLAKEILRRYEFLNLRGVNGILSLVMGTLCETKMDFKSALKWFQKANAQFLGDHNWYYLLYVLYGYARIERRLCHYAQATWYLDLVDQAVTEPEFAFLRSEVALERSRLEQEEQDTMSLLIHGKPGALSPRRPQGMHDGPSSMVLIK